MKFIVHFGSSKTGSTAIQSTLHQARDALEDLGYLYPSIANRRDHLKLLPRPRGESPLDWEFDEDAWSELRDQLSRSKADVAVLSSEQLFGRDPSPVEMFDRRLRSIASGVTYAGYLRSPKPRYLSMLQQYVKFTSGLISPTQPLMYQARLNRFRLIGGAGLQIRPFERGNLLRGDVTFDFLHGILGIEWHAAEQIPPVVINESVSAEGMALLQKVNALLTHGKRARNPWSDKLVKAVQKAEAPGRFTRPKLRAGIELMVDHVNNADMVWVRRQLGLSFPDAMADPDFGPASSYAFASEPHMSDIIEFDCSRFVELENRVLLELVRQQGSLQKPETIAVHGDDRPDLAELRRLAEREGLAASVRSLEESLVPESSDTGRRVFRGAGGPAKAQIAASLICRLVGRSPKGRVSG